MDNFANTIQLRKNFVFYGFGAPVFAVRSGGVPEGAKNIFALYLLCNG